MGTLHTNHIKKNRKAISLRSALVIEPLGGDHLDHVSESAVNLAARTGRAVEFNFNGVQLRATPSRSCRPGKLSSLYSATIQRQSYEWRMSPEGKAQAEERRIEIERKQTFLKHFVGILPGILGLKDMDALMGWLSSFTEVADDIGIDWKVVNGFGGDRYEWICVNLIAAGFHRNDLTGNPPEFFSTRERMGRYIVGQAIDCMGRDMPPHQITHKFIEDYFKLAA